jgi:hypothetical protein
MLAKVFLTIITLALFASPVMARADQGCLLGRIGGGDSAVACQRCGNFCQARLGGGSCHRA